MKKRKWLVAIVWGGLIAGALCAWWTHALRPGGVSGLASASVAWLCAMYLAVGCVRGFTFLPLTILVGFGMFFLHPVPLFLLSILGTLITTAGIYYFSSWFEVYEHFERTNKKRVHQVRAGLQKYELPVIIGWSFCPVLPTDMVCCVSGTMKLSLVKLLFGVMVGEGIICAMYIFGGMQLLQFIGLRG